MASHLHEVRGSNQTPSTTQEERCVLLLKNMTLVLKDGNNGPYNFKVGQQPHDISHVSEDEQAGNSRQQCTGSSNHGAAFDR